MKNERLETGISKLDKHLTGGIPPGAVVTCNSNPRTQAELFLHKLIANNDTLYISTIGNEEAVEAEFAKSNIDMEKPAISFASPDAPLQNTKNIIGQMKGKRLIIINSVNVLEGKMVKRGAFQEFVNWVQNLLRRTGGVMLFHRYDTGDESEYEYITDSMSDIIFEFEESIDGETITNHLHMPKCRGGVAFDERMKINLGDGISIDTSRDIA